MRREFFSKGRIEEAERVEGVGDLAAEEVSIKRLRATIERTNDDGEGVCPNHQLSISRVLRGL